MALVIGTFPSHGKLSANRKERKKKKLVLKNEEIIMLGGPFGPTQSSLVLSRAAFCTISTFAGEIAKEKVSRVEGKVCFDFLRFAIGSEVRR